MFRSVLKTRFLEDGRVEIVDPDIESLPLLKTIDPKFRIRRGKLINFCGPRLVLTKKKRLPLTKCDLSELPAKDLWAIHEGALDLRWLFDNVIGGVTLLDLKLELAKRAIRECRLCGRECGVDRLSGGRGRCGLGTDSKVGECFIHIAEEPPVNPSINVSLRGCGLKCRFCQKHELLDPEGQGHMLEASLWNRLRSRAARSLTFIGGNPDESVFAILRFLAEAPSWFRKPIVWNSNGYASGAVYRLLAGIADAYIPDMKYYRKECSMKLAGCNNYFEMFAGGLDEMLCQNVPVFVRMLIIPGHLECCHIPLIEYLAQYKDKVRLNLLGQYYPDYRVSEKESPLNRRPFDSEMKQMFSYAEAAGGPDWLIC